MYYEFNTGQDALIELLETVSPKRLIVPAYTCDTVIDACDGFNVEFVDIELDTYGVDYESLVALEPQPGDFVILQHLYGLVARDFLKCMEYCQRRAVYVIEDCAQAVGCTIGRVKVGTLSDFAIYSFGRYKPVPVGFGGVLRANTNNWTFEDTPWRRAYKLAIFYHLRQSEVYFQKRRAIAQHWSFWAYDKGYRIPTPTNGTTSVWNWYPILVSAEDKVRFEHRWKRINARFGFLAYGDEFPNAVRAEQELITLPTLYPKVLLTR